MFRTINPSNFYWIIGGSTTAVYSSATNTMVPVADANYVAWAATNVAAPIASVAELAAVMSAQSWRLPAWLFTATDTFIQPTPTTYTKGQLAAYSANARYNRRCARMIVTSLSPVAFMTDPVSTNDINSAYDYALANASAIFKWKMSDGSFVTLNKSQMTTVQNDVMNFVQACYTAEGATLASINSGSITTLAQIDAAYAAVSNVYP